MRIVTTCNKEGLDQYGYRWLESRKHWPADTEFLFFTEGYFIPDGYECPDHDLGKDGAVVTKDFRDMPEFSAWKLSHAHYIAPAWQWEVVRYAHKVFAACDAFYNYRGVGVWLDADCTTFADIPDGFIERQVEGVYLAHYGRTGMPTETGMWIMDCSHPSHTDFLDAWRGLYLTDRFKKLGMWTDCQTLDATIRQFLNAGKITTRNLSGEHHKSAHPQALSELGRYIDHCKGPRKIKGSSPENVHRMQAAG